MKLSPIIYVAKDIERALGIEPGPNAFFNYFIIAGRTPYAEKIQAKYPDNVWLVDANSDATNSSMGTFEILSLPEVSKSISKSTKEENAQLLVFKNEPRIEKLAQKNGWSLLNPSAALAEKIENKITQIEWLGDLVSYLPPHKIQKVKDITPTFSIPIKNNQINPAKKEFVPFIIQWAHSHTGDGTILVTNQKQLDEIKQKFPDRDARVTDFIKGPAFTANIVPTTIASIPAPLMNISYQITGALPFTDNPWSTIGNDWSVTHSLLTEAHIETIHEIATKVAAKMCESGWKGLFGIDLIYDEERDQIRLIEINARQPASTTFESQLQLGLRVAGLPGMTTFEAHIAELTGKTTELIIHVNDGSQIIQRVTAAMIASEMNPEKLPDALALDEAGFITIPYTNVKLNTDLLRIQNIRGIMETHNKFNSRGKKVIEIVTE